MFRGSDSAGNVKYIGRAKAVVKDVKDHTGKGRVKIQHPILGEIWAEYLTSPHQFDVPSMGDIVYVECDGAEHEFPVAWGNLTKGKDGQAEIPQAFKRTVPTNRGMYSPGGHLFEIDDGVHLPVPQLTDTAFSTENRGIRITTKAGNKVHLVEDSENQQQYILISDVNGNTIRLDYQDNRLSIIAVGKRVDRVGGDLEATIDGNNSTTSIGTSVFAGKGGTTLGNAGSTTQVLGSQVLLAGGGPSIVRLTDRSFGIGNMGAPVGSTIIQGSSKVFSG